MMQMIQQCINDSKSCLGWPSTNELTEHSKSWICKKDRKVMISKWVSSVILKDLEYISNLTLEDQQNMYTLPDLFSRQLNKLALVVQKCEKSSSSKKQQSKQDQWTEDIIEQPLDSILSWIKLRGTTQRITANHCILMDVDSNIEHNLLKHLLRHIRSKMLTASSTDQN
jgi:hypothetical protein